jgi:hypothetical protein
VKRSPQKNKSKRIIGIALRKISTATRKRPEGWEKSKIEIREAPKGRCRRRKKL